MNCQALIERFVTDRDEASVNQLGELFKTKELTLLDFIVHIGDYLKSAELAKRSTSLLLVARVLGQLPAQFLSSSEIHHLLLFISAKMSDHHILAQPAVDLFRILAKQVEINDEDCVIMIKAIFADVYVQSFPQASRYNVYVVLLHFLLHRLDAVRLLGSDFVCNFIQSMDGERDPRNLVLCFQCLQYMTKYLDIEPYKEELFEVVACYFPMEYKPHDTLANDHAPRAKYECISTMKKSASAESEETVTHEQLALSLRNVLTSTGKFASYCIPMLMEKLESDVPPARLAAMDVFIHCLDEYDARDVRTHLVPMWNLLSKQALCAESQELEQSALQAITALLQLIGKSIQNDETEISTKKFVDRAIRECENFLKELDMKLAWPATKVLQAVARANSTCASLIWSSILPLLIKQFDNLAQINHKRTVLDMMTYFLQPTGIRALVKLPSNVSEELWILVSTHFDEFPSNCLSLIHHLLQLNTTPGQVLEDNLTKFIVQGNIGDELKIKLATVLKMLASSVSFDRICTNLLSNLINSWTVPKSTPSNEVLESCIDLCHNSERCQERLERFFFPSQPFIRLLPSLFKYLSPLYVLTELFSPLFDLLASSILSDSLGKIFCSHCGSMADESCLPFIQQLYQTHLVGDAAWQSHRIVPVMYVIGNLKRKKFQNELELVFNQTKDKLIDELFKQTSNDTAEVYCYFYANLVNKLSSNAEINAHAHEVLKRCEASSDQQHIHLWTIIVKGLILSRPSAVEGYIRTVISWMNEKNAKSDFACHSLKILTNFDQHSFLLSSRADCIVHPMVKQIAFMNILAQMKPLLTSRDLLPNQMNVLVELLSNVPRSIIQDEIVSLLPILIRALTSTNESVWSSSLTSVCDLIKSDANLVVDHLDTLIPRLNMLSTYQKDLSIRITSLMCLQYLSNLPVQKIEPYRRNVIHVLKTSLDDHKRLVRKQAVETQMSWCLLNA